MADVSVKRKGRKRLRFEQDWVKKKRKLLKDAGKPYETYKGEQVPGKEVRDVLCRCRLGCSEKISSSDRIFIFEEFYKMKSHDSQNKYLYGMIVKEDVHRRRVTSGSRRSVTFRYYVRGKDGNCFELCKKAFCEVHAIRKKRVELLGKRLCSGSLFTEDGRGKHKNRPQAISEEIKERIREHIQSFPRRQSHYSRRDNDRRNYLPENLSIAEMYRLYLAKYEPQAGDNPVVKDWLYRKIFNTDFNLSFGYPRSDTCQVCDGLKVAIDAAQSQDHRDELQSTLATHHVLASQGYQSLKDDTEQSKSSSDLDLITFDLQQNLPVPTLTHSAMFYLHQLWVYNFGIHTCKDDSAVMCVWNETIAGRGSSEIISCLLQFFFPATVSLITLNMLFR